MSLLSKRVFRKLLKSFLTAATLCLTLWAQGGFPEKRESHGESDGSLLSELPAELDVMILCDLLERDPKSVGNLLRTSKQWKEFIENDRLGGQVVRKARQIHEFKKQLVEAKDYWDVLNVHDAFLDLFGLKVLPDFRGTVSAYSFKDPQQETRIDRQVLCYLRKFIDEFYRVLWEKSKLCAEKAIGRTKLPFSYVFEPLREMKVLIEYVAPSPLLPGSYYLSIAEELIKINAQEHSSWKDAYYAAMLISIGRCTPADCVKGLLSKIDVVQEPKKRVLVACVLLRGLLRNPNARHIPEINDRIRKTYECIKNNRLERASEFLSYMWGIPGIRDERTEDSLTRAKNLIEEGKPEGNKFLAC
jgi:hypothetical protein